MLQNALVRELRSTGRFRTVTVLRSDSSGDFVLTGHLYDFKEVSGNGIVARISFDAELRDLKAGKTVWTYTYIMTSQQRQRCRLSRCCHGPECSTQRSGSGNRHPAGSGGLSHEVRAACFSRSDRGLLRPLDASSSVVFARRSHLIQIPALSDSQRKKLFCGFFLSRESQVSSASPCSVCTNWSQIDLHSISGVITHVTCAQSKESAAPAASPASAVPAKPAFDFLDLRAQFASIREEVMGAVTASLKASISFLVQR